MSIIRLCVVDPEPPDARNDVLVYQVPENSRQQALLEQLLTDAGLDFIPIESKPRKRRRRAKKEESNGPA